MITPLRDFSIYKEHIETAFASWPLFCNDPAGGDDQITSCKKVIVGFFTFVMAGDI